jgi:hypothetical protein
MWARFSYREGVEALLLDLLIPAGRSEDVEAAETRAAAFAGGILPPLHEYIPKE